MDTNCVFPKGSSGAPYQRTQVSCTWSLPSADEISWLARASLTLRVSVQRNRARSFCLENDSDPG